ncbi:hypothetical protein NM688_g7357 [Phlebia brevispora]|uniref:Uncharacterized protein n=1 Tax=Phlebia brevispora TaxID=194682 RepID=A0ACC1S618_9APHY|nr:hypothetical protein NM688_g7357 [Phlebia brevispora]
MMLHPSYKLVYFSQHGWEQEWITTAENILWRSYQQIAADDLFAELDSWGKSKTEDPVGDYLKVDIVPCEDPIAYWSPLVGHHLLAQMALDFLSAPAASVDVERAFSRGGLTVSKRRHGLSDKSVRAATILGSWVSVEGLIPEEELLERFRNKSKRPRLAVAREASAAVIELDSGSDSGVETVE